VCFKSTADGVAVQCCDCCQCKELEAQCGSVAAAAVSAVENGQVHQSDDSSNVDQLRAQLLEQVLPVLSYLLTYLLTCSSLSVNTVNSL